MLANLEGALNKATKEYGEQSAEAIKAQNAFNSYSAKVNKMAANINQSKASIANMIPAKWTRFSPLREMPRKKCLG